MKRKKKINFFTPVKKMSDKTLIKYAKSIYNSINWGICKMRDLANIDVINNELEKRGYKINPIMEYNKD